MTLSSIARFIHLLFSLGAWLLRLLTSHVKCKIFFALQVATEADLGLAMADAYIDGYLSFVDKREGLLNLLLVRKTQDSVYVRLHLLTIWNYTGWIQGVCIFSSKLGIFATDSHC